MALESVIATVVMAVFAAVIVGVIKYGAVKTPKSKKPDKYDKAAFARDVVNPTVPLNEILEKCDGSLPEEEDRSIRWPVLNRPDGVQYIGGAWPQTPVLRPFRHPLYDTLVIRENGLMYGMADNVSLFNDCRFFPDHTPKGPEDTNMTQNGQLGTPLEYDLVAIDMHVVDYAKAEDVRKVLSALTCRWIFGVCTCWLTVPAGGFEPYLSMGGGIDENVLDLPKYLRERAEETRKQVSTFMSTGAVWPCYRQLFTTPDRLARRIIFTESFRLEVVGKAAPLSAPVVLKFLTRGVLYAQL